MDNLGLLIGHLAETEAHLRELIAARTGYEVEFTDRTILARFAEATTEEQHTILDMLFEQARADAKDKGFDIAGEVQQ